MPQDFLRGTPLSPTEREVLYQLASGETNNGAARNMYVSIDTVKTLSHRLFARLGACNRAHAVALGYEAGILAAGDATGQRARRRTP
jgi:DNA-binding CsgD family transcriptional regulator